MVNVQVVVVVLVMGKVIMVRRLSIHILLQGLVVDIKPLGLEARLMVQDL